MSPLQGLIAGFSVPTFPSQTAALGVTIFPETLLNSARRICYGNGHRREADGRVQGRIERDWVGVAEPEIIPENSV